MTEKRAKRASPKRHQDRERVARVKLDQLPRGTWSDERLSYPAQVRNAVDRMAVRGPSLLDLYLLQAAQCKTMQILQAEAIEERRKAKAEDIKDGTQIPGSKTFAKYDHAITQSIKHMRTICLAMGPGLTVNDQPVRLPEGMTEPEMRAVIAQLEDDEIVN